MLKVQSVVALYTSSQSAEDALRSLWQNGTNLHDVSIAALHETPVSDLRSMATMRYKGEPGLEWGGPWALLYDAVLYDVPGLGLVRIAGPIALWMAAILEREIAYPEVTLLGAGLVSIGVPIATAVKYEHALKASQSLILIHGQTTVVVAARNIMLTTVPASLLIHGFTTFGPPGPGDRGIAQRGRR